MNHMERMNKGVPLLGLMMLVCVFVLLYTLKVDTPKEGAEYETETTQERSAEEEVADVESAEVNSTGTALQSEEVTPSGSSSVSAAPPTRSRTINDVPQQDDVLQNTPQGSYITVEACESLRLGLSFYADPAAQSIKEEAQLRAEGRDDEAALLREISCFPHSTWIIGDEPEERSMEKVSRVAQHADELGKIPVFVLYNRPTYEYAGWESGKDTDEYLAWMKGVREAIGERRAWVILEPDALATAAAYGEEEQRKRTNELRTVVEMFEEGENISVYIDAGHSGWLSADKAVQLLLDAGVSTAHGFALNVSNYSATEDEKAYGDMLAERLGGARFVIDTSRNGNGPHPDAEWCNPSGRALGVRPRITAGADHLDALLWIKPAGESDGTCNGGPPAGLFWLEYALDLVRNAQG